MVTQLQLLVHGARSLVKRAANPLTDSPMAAAERKKKPSANDTEQTKAAALRKRAENEMLNNLLQGGKNLLGKVDLKNPLHTGVIGAGIGGLGGLAGSALSDGDPEKKSKLRAMLLGGLAGGGIGAGAGALYGRLSPQAPQAPPVQPNKYLQMPNKNIFPNSPGALSPEEIKSIQGPNPYLQT